MRKVLAFALTRLVIIGVVFILLADALHAVFGSRISGPLGIETLLLVLLAIVTLAVERLCANATLADIGFPARDAAADTFKGVCLGALLFSTTILILFVALSYDASFQTVNALGAGVLFYLVVALFEELLFRGVIFRLIEAMTGTWIALAVSAVLFGLVHAFNPGATIVSSVAIALEAGVLLGLAYVLTRSLWFAIGIHWAWNVFEGPVFGTQVSGSAASQTVLAARVHGPAWLTGGAFGPEAGAAAVIVCVVAGALLAARAIRFAKIVQPMWARFSTPA